MKVKEPAIYIGIIAVIISLIGLLLNYYQMKANNMLDRRKVTLIEMEKIREQCIKAVSDLEDTNFPYRNVNRTYEDEDINKIFSIKGNNIELSKDEEQKAFKIIEDISTILNYHEFIAVGIQQDIF